MLPIEMEIALDELAIRKLLARLAQAADDRDEAAYTGCLARTVRADPSEEANSVPADAYARASMARLSRGPTGRNTSSPIRSSTSRPAGIGQVFSSTWSWISPLPTPKAHSTGSRSAADTTSA
jgi:hypothetical protein